VTTGDTAPTVWVATVIGIPFYQDLNVFCHLLILVPFPCTAFTTKIYVLVLCIYAKSTRSLAQAIFLALPESTRPTCAVFKLSLFAQQDTSQRLCGHLQESETISIQRLHRENQVTFLEQRGTLLQPESHATSWLLSDVRLLKKHYVSLLQRNSIDMSSQIAKYLGTSSNQLPGDVRITVTKMI